VDAFRIEHPVDFRSSAFSRLSETISVARHCDKPTR
jgi:hypothetical protein